ncbi:MAG: translation initiation factor IF-2, partial [Clostridiales bacterium]|nr:translation initiation factor IF-2 [Clostridiales bacterium]
MSDRQQSKQPETGVDRLKAQRKGLPTLDKLVTETKRRIEGIQSALSAFERERRKRIAAEEKASLAAVEAHGVPAAAESAVPPQPPAEREPARVAPTVVPEPQAEAARPAESVPAPVEEPAAAPKTAAADEPRREKPPEKPAQAKRSQAKPAEGQEKPKPDAQPKPKAEPAVAAAPKPDAAAAEPPKAASAAAKPLPSFLVSLPKPGETRIFNTPGTTRSRTFDSTGAARPPRAYPPRPGVPGRPSGGGYVAPPPTQNNNKRGEKKTYERAERPEDKAKAAANKRTLATRKPLIAGEDDERGGGRKLHRGRNRNEQQEIMSMVSHAVVTTENMTVKMLSELIGISVAELIKQFLFLDIKVTINSVVDFDSMALVGDVLGVTLELKVAQTKAEAMEEMHDLSEDDPSVLEVRPPIVTVMGHVDHGKTSVLDAIRRTNVAQGEAGGITQHIGAYSVTLKGKNITFLDTPGHEAFTMMRARGTQVTDIAVIVIAADDGIMPQTVEAINHAKSAGVSIIVAANKIDKPAADVARLKQQLTEHELLPEEWGGDVPVVPVSAKTGEGLDSLLENILILAEVKELKANPNRAAHGTVIEAQLDKNKGPVATIIVQNGTLRVGNSLISGTSFGKVRAMTDDKGRPLKEAGPSTAVAVLGLQDVPVAGDKIYVVDSERAAKAVADERAAK